MKAKNNIPQERGFKVPDNYFDDSREQITSRLEFENIKEDSSTARFEVPDGYFDEAKRELLSTLSRKRTEGISSNIAQTTKVIPLKRYLYSFAGIAAALLLLVSILWTQSNTNTSDTFETNSIVSFVDDTTMDLEGIDFADWLTNEDIEALQDDIALEESDIIEYLEDRTSNYDFYEQ